MVLFKYKLIDQTKRFFRTSLISKQNKSKKQLKLQEKRSQIKALNHFDEFYKSVFENKWNSVRLALLSRSKCVAVLNNFGDTEETEKFLQNLGAFNLKSYLDTQKVIVSNKEKSSSIDSKIKLDDVIEQQLLQEEEKEFKIHPEGMEFKARSNQCQTESDLNEDEYVYQPEDARTSLAFDMKKAEIDTSRLITSDSILDSNLQQFIPAMQLRGVDGFIAESDYYKYYKTKTSNTVQEENELELDFPNYLKVYTFDRGEVLDFPEPAKSINNVYNYLKVDGADLLVTLALNLQVEDSVLDLCSNSGNIPFCIFQTLRPKYLLCAFDRKGHKEELFRHYIFENSPMWKNTIFFTSTSLNEDFSDYLFDKVLVDAPSTFDKLSVLEKTNNIFHPSSIKKRLRLPEIQSSLLLQGMKLVRPGGTVVYTTETLSPVQNDGVVNRALTTAWEESKLQFIVKNLTPAFQHMNSLFNFGDYLNMKFGKLVVPFAPINFGPRYICKLVRRNEEVKEEFKEDKENSNS